MWRAGPGNVRPDDHDHGDQVRRHLTTEDVGGGGVLEDEHSHHATGRIIVDDGSAYMRFEPAPFNGDVHLESRQTWNRQRSIIAPCAGRYKHGRQTRPHVRAQDSFDRDTTSAVRGQR